jgi:hypothetical protein
MINISSAMAGQFAFAAAEITAEVTRLGPTPLRGNGSAGHVAHGQQESQKEHVADDD